MLKDNQIDKINHFLENKVFTYNGKILYGVDVTSDFDFKFKILGYKKMISVGEWYDYTKVSVTVFNFRDNLSKLLFTDNELNNVVDRGLWKVKNSLSQEINTILRYFDNDVRVKIEDLKIINPKTTNIQEQKMSRQTVRSVVKDIVEVLKKKRKGNFYLPKDSDFYTFTSFPVEFSVELYLSHNNKSDGFKINADYSSDDEVIEMIIVYNPKTLESNLYNIIGELNEVISHELEHSLQNYRGELEYDDESEELSPLEYYLQPHEISAQIKGFKRLSKLRKQPIEHVVRQWFESHKDIHSLTPEEEKIVINRLLNN